MPSRCLLLLLGAALLSGCFAGKVKQGMDPDFSKAAQLQIGTSTRADVLGILGAPTSIVRLWRGEAYVYQHVIAKRSGLWLLLVAFYRDDTQRDAITVIVDEGGVVRGVGTKDEADQAAYGTPWGE